MFFPLCLMPSLMQSIVWARLSPRGIWPQWGQIFPASAAHEVTLSPAVILIIPAISGAASQSFFVASMQYALPASVWVQNVLMPFAALNSLFPEGPPNNSGWASYISGLVGASGSIAKTYTPMPYRAHFLQTLRSFSILFSPPFPYSGIMSVLTRSEYLV